MSRAVRDEEGEGELKTEKLQIRKSIIVNASLGAVFKAISDPEELTQWFPDQAILEPKVGGKMKFSFYKEKSSEHTCETDTVSEGIVKELIPNKKLSYTWKQMDVPGFPETVVTWELEEIDVNKTKVKLFHSGFTGREERKSFKEHDQGWSYFISRLEKYCTERNK
jgi:uncharacterized protein YndB with AHSA1/START domain